MPFRRPRLRVNPLSAAGLVMVGSLSVQCGSALATRMFPVIGPGTTVMLRVVFAALIVGLIARPRWSRLRGLGRRGWVVLAAYGLSMAIMNLSYYQALELLPMGTTVTLEFLGPLTLALAGSRRGLDVLWAAMALAGVAMITGFRLDGISPLGVFFALAAGAAWAVYLLMSQRTSRLLPMREGLSIGLLVATVVTVPFGLGGTTEAVLHPWVLLAAMGVALLSTALPYGIDLVALSVVPTHVYGVLMSLNPALAALCGLVILGQHLSAWQWAAVLMVVCASAGSTLIAARNNPRPAV